MLIQPGSDSATTLTSPYLHACISNGLQFEVQVEAWIKIKVQFNNQELKLWSLNSTSIKIVLGLEIELKVVKYLHF